MRENSFCAYISNMQPAAEEPRAPRYSAFIALTVGSIAFVGHTAGIDILTRLHPAFFQMRTGVSISIILLGIALLPSPIGSRQRRGSAMAALVTGALGLIMRIPLWAGAFDRFGATPDHLAWLEMSSLTAVCVVCCASSVLLLETSSTAPDRKAAALLLNCLAASVCGMSLLADVVPLPRVGSAFSARMAIHTAATLAVISTGAAWSIGRSLLKEAGRAVRPAVAVLAMCVAICLVGWRAVLANRAAFVIAQANADVAAVVQLFNQHTGAQAERLSVVAELTRRVPFDPQALAGSGISPLEASAARPSDVSGCSGAPEAEQISKFIARAQRSLQAVTGRIDCEHGERILLWGVSSRPGTVLVMHEPFRRVLERSAAPVVPHSYNLIFNSRDGHSIPISRGQQPFAGNTFVEAEVILGGIGGTLRMYMNPNIVRGGLAWIAELGMLCGLLGAFTLAMGVYLGVAAHLRYTAVAAAQVVMKRQAQQLLASNASLQQFAYVASHDLQEPLRIVTNYAQLLRRRFTTQLGPDGERFLGFLETASQRMSALIGDLLTYSRVVSADDVPFSFVDMNVVLRLAADNLAIAIQESGAEIDAPRPLPRIPGYQAHLVQLMQNLISNAVKYRSARSPQIEIRADREGDSWVFSVRDNGIGLAPEYQERIFEIFRRLHSAAVPGTGIGLALCKAIVEEHGGSIWVVSEPGAGSTFFFKLPAEAVIGPTSTRSMTTAGSAP